MRKIIKLRAQRKGSSSLAERLGIANTPLQKATYLQALKAAKAQLARAKKAKPAARAKIAQFPKAVARAQKRKAA